MNGVDGMSAWLTIIICGMVTLAIRASFIMLPPATRVPTWLTGSLKYVAAVVLPALIVPDVLFRDVASGDMFNIYRILAAILASACALKTKNIFDTMIVGMAALWLLKWWGPF